MPNTAPVGVAYSDPAIVSGSIDATPIGATTRSSVAATTVNATGSVSAGSATAVTAGGSTTGLLLSSTASLGIFVGSGAPTMSAAQGSLYLRTDGSSTSTRLYVNTNGTTGWTNITTAT